MENIQEYYLNDEMKNLFKDKNTFLGLKVKKLETQNIINFYKGQLIKYKNISTVKNLQNCEYNIIILNKISNDTNKETLSKEIESHLLNPDFKLTFLELAEESVELSYENLDYYECLRRLIPKEIKDIPSGYELIGNIAHMNLRECFYPYKKLIGKLILDKNPYIKTVVNKTSKIDNVFRTYQMEILGGEENFLVKHNEGGCKFEFDLRKVYWCSRLSFERDRMLTLFKKGEVLVDAFCGVGPLSIRASKKKDVIVYANDLNPDCYLYLEKNKEINKIKKNLNCFNLDARKFIRGMLDGSNSFINEEKNFDGIFPKNLKIDHIYMNLPKDAIEFLDAFRGSLTTPNNIYNKENLPIIHVYGFSNAPNSKEELLKRCSDAMDLNEFPQECLIDVHNIRDVSPKKHMFCISFKLPYKVAFGESVKK